MAIEGKQAESDPFALGDNLHGQAGSGGEGSAIPAAQIQSGAIAERHLD